MGSSNLSHSIMLNNVYYLAMCFPDFLLNRFYRSSLQFDLHDQMEYRHFLIFETNGVVKLIAHEGTISELKLRLDSNDGIQDGNYVIDGSKLIIAFPSGDRFEVELISPQAIRITAEDDFGYFDSNAVYELVEET